MLVASTKRKTPARRAESDSEEDQDRGVDSASAREKRPRPDTLEEGAKAAGPASGARRRRKAFAWMDSESGEDAGEGSAEREEEAEEEARRDGCDLEVSAEALDEVQSFGRMMMLAPNLQKWLQSGRRGPADVVAACRALARTKFFDGDILEDLYSALRKLLRGDRLDISQTNDAIVCLKTLNAYDREVFSAVAKAFKAKTGAMDSTTRSTWLEIFKGFGHGAEGDFLQLLEVPPLPQTAPGYRKLRCWHHSRGRCSLDSSCTFSHDSRAPLSLGEGGREDWWRSKSVMMTQNQKTLGDGAYGLGPLGRGGPLSSFAS